MRPTQSMLMPYSQRSPGSKASGRRNAASLPAHDRAACRWPRHSAACRRSTFVGEAGGMGQQVLQRDRPLRRAQQRRAGRVEARRAPAARSSAGSPISGTGASRLSLPSSTSCIAATEVIALVIEAMRNTVSSVIAGPPPTSRSAERALVERPVRGRRHRDDPRHLARLDRAAQRRVDLCLRFRLAISPPIALINPQSRRKPGPTFGSSEWLHGWIPAFRRGCERHG